MLQIDDEMLKKIDSFLDDLLKYTFECKTDENKKIEVTKRMKRAQNGGTLPSSFVLRIIRSDKDQNIKNSRFSKKMELLFETEYLYVNKNDYKNSVISVYKKLKEYIK